MKTKLDELSPEFKVALEIYKLTIIEEGIAPLKLIVKRLGVENAEVVHSLNKLSDWSLIKKRTVQIDTTRYISYCYTLDETFQECIEKIYRKIYDKSDMDEPASDARIYVPKEIGLSFADNPEIDNPSGIGVINSLGQCLYKNKNSESFSVVGEMESDNIGDNFYYRRVKNPVKNETYLVCHRPLSLNNKCLFDIENYRPYLSNGYCCYWHDTGTRYDVFIYNTVWNYYYRIEVKPQCPP